MNPSFVHEGPAPRRRWFHRLRPLLRGFSWFIRLFTRDLFGRPSPRDLRIDVGTRLSRFVRGLLYRLMFAPVILSLIVIALVYTGTHPPAVASAMDPTYHGIYYDPVNFLADDG